MFSPYWGGSSIASGGLLNAGGPQQNTNFPRFNFAPGGVQGAQPGNAANPNPYVPGEINPNPYVDWGGKAAPMVGNLFPGEINPNPYANPFHIGRAPSGGSGTLPSGQSVSTAGYGPGGMQVDNLFGTGGIGDGPQASNAAFGTQRAAAGTTPASWQNFQYDKPQSAFEQNYNFLKGINPELATAYGTSPFHNQEFKSGIDAMQHGGQAFNPEGNSWGDSMGNALINAYNPNGGDNAITQSLGLGADWQSQFNPQMLGIDPSGKTITVNGQTYTLPATDTAYAQPKLWWQT